MSWVGVERLYVWGGDFLHLLEGSCAEDQIESNVLYPWLGMKQ